MLKFRYHSYHKIIVGLIIIGWAGFHFAQRDAIGIYYDTGKLKRSGSAEKGKNHGVWTWYYENGTEKMKGVFENGTFLNVNLF